MPTTTAARTTGTAASEVRARLGALALLVAALAGCGATSAPPRHAPARASPPPADQRATPAGFAWLRPAPAPRAWPLARLPSGAAALSYPRGWRPLAGDPGTRSAALVARDGTIAGYLNLTPRMGEERRRGWARFRLRHNAGEGNRDIVLVASARRLRFRDGRGSCVIDRYRTGRHRYREIACLVAGRRATTVVVGAALPSQWAALGPPIERAISSLET